MSEVKETTPYENCLDVQLEKSDLSEFLDIEDVNEPDWKQHWKGMPEFIQEKDVPYKTIQISFRNEEDYQEFAKMVNQNLTEKTKSIWYPKLISDIGLYKWIDENDSE